MQGITLNTVNDTVLTSFKTAFLAKHHHKELAFRRTPQAEASSAFVPIGSLSVFWQVNFIPLLLFFICSQPLLLCANLFTQVHNGFFGILS